MRATLSFPVSAIPSDPYEAEKFLLEQTRELFYMAHEADVTAVLNFATERFFSSPFEPHISLSLLFAGNIAKTFVTTKGAVTGP